MRDNSKKTLCHRCRRISGYWKKFNDKWRLFISLTDSRPHMCGVRRPKYTPVKYW